MLGYFPSCFSVLATHYLDNTYVTDYRDDNGDNDDDDNGDDDDDDNGDDDDDDNLSCGSFLSY